MVDLDDAWDPSKHPRHPAGTPEGGQFSGLTNRQLRSEIEKHEREHYAYYREIHKGGTPDPEKVKELNERFKELSSEQYRRRTTGRMRDCNNVELFDTVVLDDDARVRITPDGYLVATPRIARAGVQIYAGREVGRPDLKEVRVYRPPEEVFHHDAMHSYAHRPVTLDHPPFPVTSDNWRKHAVGQLGDEVVRDGNYVRVPMVMMDKSAIRIVQDGKKELSNGYTCDLDWGSGTTPEGEAYDATQRNIRGNHLAVVSVARGGHDLRIGDDGKENRPMNMRTIIVDGISCEMTDTSAQVIQRALDQKDAELKRLGDARDTYEEELNKKKKKEEELEKDGKTRDAAHVADMAKKDSEIADLKKQLGDATVTPDKLDQMVQDRAETAGRARAVLGDKLVVQGKTNAEMRRQVVDSKLGDRAKGWDDSQVEAAFTSLTADVKPGETPAASATITYRPGYAQDMATAFAAPGGGAKDARQEAYDAYCKELSESWRPKKVA